MSGDICNEKKMGECLASSGEHLDVLCETCKLRDKVQNPYIANLFKLLLMIKVGFQIDAIYLDATGWSDLSLLDFHYTQQLTFGSVMK